jgi:hypothetical protein
MQKGQKLSSEASNIHNPPHNLNLSLPVSLQKTVMGVLQGAEEIRETVSVRTSITLLKLNPSVRCSWYSSIFGQS